MNIFRITSLLLCIMLFLAGIYLFKKSKNTYSRTVGLTLIIFGIAYTILVVIYMILE